VKVDLDLAPGERRTIEITGDRAAALETPKDRAEIGRRMARIATIG
jgi:hypothetical protein